LPSTNTSEIDQKSLKLSVKAWQKMVSFGAVFPMAIPGQNAHCDHHEVEHGLRQLPVCLGSFQPNLLLLRFQRGFFFPAAAKHFSVVLHDLDANRCT
jgi:hypothetical protein